MNNKLEKNYMLEELKKIVYEQNVRLPKSNLVILSEGNVSQISEDRKYTCIKPSGVPYDQLMPNMMVLVDMQGKVVEGNLRPSSDTPTHLELYKSFPQIGGVVHTHSPFASIFAQTRKPILCYGTTHADAFYGNIPVTRQLTDEEIMKDYEVNTGKVISEVLNPERCCGVLVAHHGPFSFGKSAQEAVDHACILEKVATMALLATYDSPIPEALIKKHFYRKHGEGRYYGQKSL